ncbi:hypothetical protein Noda2021_05570 [Candidatus Dependentiae bacterium Noda2021]|nr:hypothetical protein Noda2021_05570 [Candidatus Dependentiae bacterium Noda2021]
MAMYLGVKKYAENLFEVIYEAKSGDFGGVHYFIYVKKGERIIYFFKDKELKTLLGTVNLDKSAEPIRVDGIESSAIWHSISKLIKCMQTNYYKDCLDFCA